MSGTLAPEAPAEARGLTWQKLFLGDWSRSSATRSTSAASSSSPARSSGGSRVGPSPFSSPHRRYCVLARIVNLPRFYDFSLIVVMVLIAWGEVLGLYDSWKGYDNVVHFTVPFLVTGMFYVLLVRLGVLPELSDLKQVHQKFGFFLTAVMLGMAIGAGLGDRRVVARRVGGRESRRHRDGHRDRSDLGHDGRDGERDRPHALEPRRALVEAPPGRRARDKRFGSFLTLRSDKTAPAG